MISTRELSPLIGGFLQTLLKTLGDETDIGNHSELLERYRKLKADQGNRVIAEKLGLNQDELEEFNRVLRNLERISPESEERNDLIVQLRFISWMESLGDERARLSGTDIPQLSEEMGRKQIRALELILRSLVNERFGTQEALEKKLAELLGDAVVEKWKKNADPGDLLSGTCFSELASIFVNGNEYPSYSRIFEDTSFLTYLKDKRKTIQNFLEDIRRIRNILAHHRRISNTQLSLLDIYYEELVSPVQDSHDQGQTRVNPDNFLDTVKEELEAYFKNLREDMSSVRGEIAEFRAAIESSLNGIAVDSAEIRQTTHNIHKRQKLIVAGVAIAICGIALLLYLAFANKEATQSATETIIKSSQEIKASADSIREGFSALGKLGGLIDSPERPEQFYHNARIYELRGDFLNARKTYERFLAFDLDTIDPYLRYLNILKAQEGFGGAASSFQRLRPKQENAAFLSGAALLLKPEKRLPALQNIASKNPEFAPAHYLLSQQFSQKQLGQQSLNNKRDEKKALERFLVLARKGDFLRFFIDKDMANEWLEDAETRLKPLSTLQDTQRFTYTTSHSNSGILLNFNFAEAVRNFSYRLESDTAFTDNGTGDYIDQRLGTPAAKTYIQLPLGQKDTTLFIKYKDIQGTENGPFEVRFKALNELARDQIKILEMTKNNWLSFRGDMPELLYFTHLQSYRCGIAEVAYGLDKETPDTLWKGLDQCDPGNPYQISTSSTLFQKVPASTRLVSIQLTYKDGRKSEIVRIRR